MSKKEAFTPDTAHDWFKEVKIILKTIFVVGLVLFFVGNIIASQKISPLYFQVINKEEEGTIQFLKKAKSLADFKSLAPEMRGLFMEYEGRIYEDDRKRRQMIETLEVLLQKNPKSRDILYSLHLLYVKDGNTAKAKEYLDKAREVDPMVGKE